jgi:2-dehydropantoate 2-reductase
MDVETCRVDEVLVVGGGALGTLFGAMLARQVPVRVLVRSAVDVDVIRARGGLEIVGDAVVPALVDSQPAIADGASVVLVALKTHDTGALAAIRPYLAPDTIVVTVQNGIGNDDRIRAALGSHVRIVLAPTSEGATRLDPGRIRRGGVGATTIGVPRGDEPFDVEPLRAMFSASGLVVAAASPIETAVWRKLIANVAINPVTALAGELNRVVVENAAARARALALGREAFAVALAEGVALPYDDPADDIDRIARATSANRSSIEIDAINGAIVERARAFGIATPENARIVDEMRMRILGTQT